MPNIHSLDSTKRKENRNKSNSDDSDGEDADNQDRQGFFVGGSTHRCVFMTNIVIEIVYL